MRSASLLALLLTLAAVIAAGTVLFRHLEGWSWIDSYFFTVVTLSTVGYGSLVPETDAGKIATTIFIYVGLGIFALVIQRIGSYALAMRDRNAEWLVARLDYHHRREQERAPEETEAANREDAPHPPAPPGDTTDPPERG